MGALGRECERHVGEHRCDAGGGDGAEAGDLHPQRRTRPDRTSRSAETLAGVDHPRRRHRDERPGGSVRSRRTATAGSARPAVEQAQVVDGAAEHITRPTAEPPIHHRPEVVPEIDVMRHPIPPPQTRQRRPLPIQPTTHMRTDHEMRRRTPVIGPTTIVAPTRPPELRERHHRHPRRPPPIEHPIEPRQRRVELPHPRLVLIGLTRMRIEIPPPQRQHPKPQIGIDQPRRDLRLGDDLGVGERVLARQHVTEA